MHFFLYTLYIDSKTNNTYHSTSPRTTDWDVTIRIKDGVTHVSDTLPGKCIFIYEIEPADLNSINLKYIYYVC